MYQNILIPIDLSAKNASAIRAARRLADPETTTIVLLHVIETLRDIPFEDAEDFYSELRDKAEEVIARWTKEFAAASKDVIGEIVYGRRGREIIRMAEEQNADLIVLRSHVFDRDHPASSFGTLSHEVALLAPCSVLLVRPLEA